MSELFKFDIIDNKTPMGEDNFYHWVLKQPIKTERKSDLDWVFKYLNELGFVKGKHHINSDELKRLKYIFETAYRDWLPSYEVVNVNDLFVSVPVINTIKNPTHKINGFNNLGLTDGFYFLTDKLIELINIQGCIHAPTQQNIYFQAINGCLYYKYQTIIGGRKLCNIGI